MFHENTFRRLKIKNREKMIQQFKSVKKKYQKNLPVSKIFRIFVVGKKNIEYLLFDAIFFEMYNREMIIRIG